MSDRFTGCLLGGMIGDVIGAVVEGESPRYLSKTYGNLDQIIARDSVPEILGGKWQVGRFTDDTQMSLCVAEWLCAGEEADGQALLSRFYRAYHPARRYGSGTRWILEAFPQRPEEWKALATIMFAEGSYGNGSAMRAAPIGLAYCEDQTSLTIISETASRTTHSHPQAIVGATLQAAAVALAVKADQNLEPLKFLEELQKLLSKIRWRTEAYQEAFRFMATSLKEDFPEREVVQKLGTGITALEAVPTSLYCFLKHLDSYEDCLHLAIFSGGDTDTIAAMAGSLSGAYLGVKALPKRWLARVREETYSVGKVAQVARQLWGLSEAIS